ncbi:MAG: winged helix-turn-helix transcriptional regulator [Clostridia bacterium]|nr:winged helix-turn-helix transcriptional regulator [Clostridia bacterium]
MRILCSLSANGASRYNELLHNVKGISNTMLSQTLREMEQDRLIVRAEYLEVPVRVEYDLTDRARQLQPILKELARWKMEEDSSASAGTVDSDTKKR